MCVGLVELVMVVAVSYVGLWAGAISAHTDKLNGPRFFSEKAVTMPLKTLPISQLFSKTLTEATLMALEKFIQTA